MAVFYDDGTIRIRSMEPEDAETFYDTYLSYGWHPRMETYENYYKDQQEGTRLVFIAVCRGKVRGLCTLVLQPEEGPWGGRGVPEIVDLSVFPDARGNGIGNKLLDVAESEAARRADSVFLAVGVHSGYGPAQRIYVKRGYIPDGSGVWYHGKVLEQYAPCANDDDLVLYLSRKLR